MQQNVTLFSGRSRSGAGLARSPSAPSLAVGLAVVFFDLGRDQRDELARQRDDLLGIVAVLAELFINRLGQDFHCTFAAGWLVVAEVLLNELTHLDVLLQGRAAVAARDVPVLCRVVAYEIISLSGCG